MSTLTQPTTAATKVAARAKSRPTTSQKPNQKQSQKDARMYQQLTKAVNAHLAAADVGTQRVHSVRFTKKSNGDKYKVTVALSDLAWALPRWQLYEKGQYLKLVFKDTCKVEVLFVVNREGESACTNAWPQQYQAPRVGSQVEYLIVDADRLF